MQDQEINHNDVVAMSKLYTEAYGHYGESLLLGALFAHVSEATLQDLAHQASISMARHIREMNNEK